MNMTEQQKARIVELAKGCENALTIAAHAWDTDPFSDTMRHMDDLAARRSTEAFRIAQEARS